jgi:drug/metabolite transporter (DMT)-like permease
MQNYSCLKNLLTKQQASEHIVKELSMEGIDKLSLSRSYVLLLLASFGFSFILIFSTLLKNVGVSSLQQVFFRIALALPLIFILIKGKANLQKKDLPYFTLIGFVFSAFLLSALSSIILGCPIAVATALIYTQPFFTAVLAAASRREKITKKKSAIIASGIIGVFLVSGIATEQYSTLNISGISLALLGGFLYALYLFFKRTSKTQYTPLQGLFNTFIFAVLWAVILGFSLQGFVKNPSFTGFSTLYPYQLLLLTLLALFSTALPYGCLNYIKPNEVTPTTEGTILLLDPTLHNIWAILIFQQYISPIRYTGVALILLSALAMLKTK